MKETILANGKSVFLTETDDWKMFSYEGTVYVDNLFFVHDTRGIPLSASLMYCVQYNCVACIKQFVADAAKAGWKAEKIKRTLNSAIRESGYSKCPPWE